MFLTDEEKEKLGKNDMSYDVVGELFTVHRLTQLIAKHIIANDVQFTDEQLKEMLPAMGRAIGNIKKLSGLVLGGNDIDYDEINKDKLEPPPKQEKTWSWSKKAK